MIKFKNILNHIIDRSTLFRIIKDAISSMLQDADGEPINKKSKACFFIITISFPLTLSIIAYSNNIERSNIENYVGTAIAIFTGLFFALLLSIGDKIKTEQNNPDKDKENFQRFKNNMRQISSITLYSVLLGIVIFSLVLINAILDNPDNKYSIDKSLTAIVIFLLGHYILALIQIIVRFYYTSKDEINNTL